MKTILKKLLMPILASQPISSMAYRLLNCGTPIFMLHRITPAGQPKAGAIDASHLRNCLQYLHKNNYHWISLEQLILSLQNQKPLPSKAVCFTMDDGYIDQAQIAAPIFIEYDCPVTFFVITDMLDNTDWPWDAKVSWLIDSPKQASLETSTALEQLGIFHGKITCKRTFRRSIQAALKKIDAKKIPAILQNLAEYSGRTIPSIAPPGFQPMNWSDARQLEKQGVCFAPHSVSHNIMSRLDQEDMEREVNHSWQIINNELSNPLKVFCYPTGRATDFGRREIEALEKSGYLGAVSTTTNIVTSNNQSQNYIYSLPRLVLPDNMTDFIQYCSWVGRTKCAHNNQ